MRGYLHFRLRVLYKLMYTYIIYTMYSTLLNGPVKLLLGGWFHWQLVHYSVVQSNNMTRRCVCKVRKMERLETNLYMHTRVRSLLSDVGAYQYWFSRKTQSDKRINVSWRFLKALQMHLPCSLCLTVRTHPPSDNFATNL